MPVVSRYNLCWDNFGDKQNVREEESEEKYRTCKTTMNVQTLLKPFDLNPFLMTSNKTIRFRKDF